MTLQKSCFEGEHWEQTVQAVSSVIHQSLFCGIETGILMLQGVIQ